MRTTAERALIHAPGEVVRSCVPRLCQPCAPVPTADTAVAHKSDSTTGCRYENGAENLAWLRRLAVSLLRNDTTCKRSLREKSVKVLCDHEFLLQLLSQVSGSKEDT